MFCRLIAGSPDEFGSCIDGDLHEARFKSPVSLVATRHADRVYVAEYKGHTIRCIDTDKNTCSRFIGFSGEYGKNDGTTL